MVCDAGNLVIRKINLERNVTTLAGSTGGYTDGQGINAHFQHLQGIAVDNDGNLFVAYNGNFKIRKIMMN